jgi:hypothetical protein
MASLFERDIVLQWIDSERWTVNNLLMVMERSYFGAIKTGRHSVDHLRFCMFSGLSK